MANDASLFTVAQGAFTDTTDSESFKIPESDRILSVQATWDVTTPAAKTFITGVAEVQTLNFPDEATALDGDTVVLEDAAGTKWALALSKQGAAVKTFTFLAKASCVERDFMLFYDASGGVWAIGVNKSGTATAPTAQAWLDIPAARKSQTNISSATTEAQVAALYVTAMNALTGFTDKFTLTDNTDGTVTVTCDQPGPVSEPVSYKGDAGTTAGTTPTGTSIVGVEATEGYLTAEPTSDEWEAVDADHRDTLDITGLSTDIAIAAAAEIAFNALDGFTDALTTDDTAADGTMITTGTEVGSAVNPVVKNADGSGAGSISGVQTTAGTGGVNLGTSTVLSTAHGMATGLKVRLTTSAVDLPDGLAVLTDYWVIAPDANHLQFAASLADAQAGTEIELVDRGTGTHTVTAEALSASIKLQRSVDNTNWTDMLDAEMVDGITNSQTISADGSYIWLIPAAYWPYVRAKLTLAGGQVTLASAAYSK